MPANRTIELKITANEREAIASINRVAEAARKLRENNNFSNFGGSTRTTTTRATGADAEMRRAMADIKRMEADRVRMERDVTRQIEREAKQQATAKTREARRAANELIREIDRIQKAEAQQAQNKSVGRSVGIGAAVGSFAGNVVATAVIATTAALKEGAAAWFSYAAAMEQTKVGFTTLLGSSQAATAHLKDLENFAKTTPFEFAELTQASRRFQGVGVEAAKVIPLMKDIGNAAAAAGASGEQLNGSTLAFSQIIAKGKLSAEELNQLSERGIPGLKILSSELGKTSGEVLKLAEQGKISSDIFLAAFQQFSQQNYGDAMLAQSKTFNGALSNIKDSLLIAANTAFQPLFDKITGLAVGMAADIEKQNGDFEKIGGVIFEYIGKGFVGGVEALGGWLVSYTARRFTELVTEGRVFNSLGEGFIRGIQNGVGGVSRQITDAIGATSPEVKFNFKSTAEIGGVKVELDKLTNTIKQVKTAADGAPDLAKLLKAQEAKQQTEFLNKTIDELASTIATFGNETQVAATKQKLLEAGISDFNSVAARTALLMAQRIDDLKKNKVQTDALVSSIKDLGMRITFFGDETQVAATKQQLLTAGVTDFNSGLAKTAIGFADYLDKLQAAKTKQDEYSNNLKSTREELEKVRKDAEFQIRYPNATDLDKFNNGLGRVAANFRELRGEAQLTEQAIRNALIFQGAGDRSSALKRFQDEINSLSANQSPFEDKLKGILSNFNLKKEDFDSILNDIRPRIVDFYTSLGKARNEEETKFITDRAHENAQLFYEKFKTAAGVNFSAKDDPVFNYFIRLWNAMQDGFDTDRLKTFNSAMDDLNVKMQESADLTEVDRVQKLLLSGAYKDLTAAQKDSLVNKAAEVDQFKQLREVQEKAQEFYDRTTDFFENKLHTFREGGFKGLFKSILGDLEDFLIKSTAKLLASKFFKFFTGQDVGIGNSGGVFGGAAASVSGSSGGLFGNIVSGIFGGGRAIGPGGTAPFNPNFFTGGGRSPFDPVFGNLPAGGGSGIGGGTGAGMTTRTSIVDQLRGLLSGRPTGGGGIGGVRGLGGLGASVASMLPLLGGGLGSMLGGQSRTGSILGGIGGGIAGASALALLAPGVFGAIGTGAGLSAASTGVLFGLATNPFTIGIAGALLVGSYFLGRNAQRNKDEKARSQYRDQAVAAINELINRAKSGDTNAISQGETVRQQYIQQVSQLKDKKTRNIALNELNEPNILWRKFKELSETTAVVRAAEERRRVIVPEFQDGGFVSQYGEFKRRYGILSGGTPGVDSVPTLAMAGEAFLTKEHQYKLRQVVGFDALAYIGLPNYPKRQEPVQKFADGGIVRPSNPSTASVTAERPVNVTIYLEGEIDAARIKRVAIDGMNSFEGERVTIKHIRNAKKNREI